MDYKIVRLTDRPELKEQAARWFHEKWGIPLEAYMESMEECLEEKGRYHIVKDIGIIQSILPIKR